LWSGHLDHVIKQPTTKMIQLPKSQEIRFDRSMIQWKYITRHHTIGIRNPYLAEPLSSLHGWLMIFTFHVPAWILRRRFTELMGCLYLLSCNTLTGHAWVSLSLLATVHVRDGGWLCWGCFYGGCLSLIGCIDFAWFIVPVCMKCRLLLLGCFGFVRLTLL